MNEYVETIKKKLENVLNQMEIKKSEFVKNPEKDFVRNRKLNFKEMIKILLCMGGNSLKIELMKYFSYDVETASCSAFVQQRDKILPKALEFMFKKFTELSVSPKYFDGYRLLAVDGSDLNISRDPKDLDNHIKSNKNDKNDKGYNLLHLNAMYDLVNRIYVDAIIQFGKKENEFQALVDMVDRSNIQEKTIILADRGYESYNVFEHIQRKGWNYIIRVKDINSNGITARLILPKKESFDIEYSTILTRRQTNKIKDEPEKYKFMPSNQKFDYLPVGDKGTYEMKFRIVRFLISENNYETIITNLSAENFSLERIKETYHMRWGIETSYRELKYSIGLINFHSKKVDYIIQEIFARLTMHNFCEIIITNIVIKSKQRKYSYQVNFTFAISVCMHYFRLKNDASPPNVEALIQKNILPVRPGRKDPRKVKANSTVSFIYRVA